MMQHARPSEREPMKKIVVTLVAFLLTLGMLAVIPGCGPSNEELIMQAVTKKYDAYKNVDDEALTNLVTSLENEGLAELGIDETEFTAAIVDGFDYHVDNIAVEDETATVTITFAGKSYTDLLDSISQITEELANDPSFAELSQDEKRTTVGKMVMDAFHDLEIKHETIDLNYELVDNDWQEADNREGLRQIDNILFAR